MLILMSFGLLVAVARVGDAYNESRRALLAPESMVRGLGELGKVRRVHGREAEHKILPTLRGTCT